MSETDVDTTPVPTEPLVEHLVALAREIGESHDWVSPPERELEADVDWSWSDLDWDIQSSPEDNEILLRGMTTGEYSVQTRSATYNPPGAAHPAEYEHREVEVGVDIHVDLTNGTALDFGSFEIEANNL